MLEMFSTYSTVQSTVEVSWTCQPHISEVLGSNLVTSLLVWSLLVFLLCIDHFWTALPTFGQEKECILWIPHPPFAYSTYRKTITHTHSQTISHTHIYAYGHVTFFNEPNTHVCGMWEEPIVLYLDQMRAESLTFCWGVRHANHNYTVLL